jgi:hypothetical protein
MSCIKKLGLLCVTSAMICTPLVPSLAQGAPAGFMTNYVAARDVGGHHCSALTWHINRMVQPDKTVNLSGPIWFEDGSGVSFATGTGQPDGKFTLDVKMMSGDGPTGTITGQRMRDGSVNATAVGPDCFAGKFHLAPGQTSNKM